MGTSEIIGFQIISVVYEQTNAYIRSYNVQLAAITYVYGTAQRQLDSRGYFTRVILSCCMHPLLRVHAYTHAKV